MSELEFLQFRGTFVTDWAGDLAEVDDLGPAEARAEAERRTTADLPLGLATPGHHLWMLAEEGHEAPLGTAWASLDTTTGRAFLEDLTLAPAHRGLGHGRRALVLLEAALRSLGARRLALHVYAGNTRARALYEHAGYRPTGLKLQKWLDRP